VQLSAALPRPRQLPRPRLPVRLVAALLALAVLLGGAWLWVRDSSLVGVRDVTVVGVSSSQGAQVRSALRAAAADMTTLHVREDALRDAVRGFSSVAGLRVQTDFPHGLTIEVVERHPVAVVTIGGQVVPVGANGRLMRGLKASQPLAAVKATRIAPGDRVSDPVAVGAVTVLAQAPLPLRRRVSRAYAGPKGLTLDLRQGPLLYFGTPDAAAAKWMAAARVLAEPSAAGAVYLDVRVPGRVAAGGLGAVEEPDPDPLAPTPQVPSTNPQPQPENTASLNP
jgi:cell division protein FtsQ